MRDRAKQKEQVQQVVMEGKSSFGKKKEDTASKKKDVAFLLLGGDENGDSNSKDTSGETSTEASTPKEPMSQALEAMYHEGEGEFSGNITPVP